MIFVTFEKNYILKNCEFPSLIWAEFFKSLMLANRFIRNLILICSTLRIQKFSNF